jgi:hypothetical protein
VFEFGLPDPSVRPFRLTQAPKIDGEIE